MTAVQESCKEFKSLAYQKEALEQISKISKLSTEDAQKWYDGVKFSDNGEISTKVLLEAVSLLKTAGVLSKDVDITDLYDKNTTKII